MKQSWEEIGDIIGDGFHGLTTTTWNDCSFLVFHCYKIGSEDWLTIKEEHSGEPVSTVNIQGQALKELYEFIGKAIKRNP